jgi:hypothetical protein
MTDIIDTILYVTLGIVTAGAIPAIIVFAIVTSK